MNQSSTPIPRIKFEITAKNINEACKADSRHCMIADAIAYRLPTVRNISVDMMTIRWSDPLKGWRYVFLTPKPAQIALVRFDMGLKIEPFEFNVRSGHAVPMYLGSGKQRKRAHKVPDDKILKATDKGTIVHSVGRDSVPMWPEANSSQKSKVSQKSLASGRPKIWHPSHNSLRQFGFRGFTQDFVEKT
jgi:hypothetical protein